MSPHRLGDEYKGRALGQGTTSPRQRPTRGIRIQFDCDLAAVAIVGQSSSFQFATGLLEQGFGFGGVPAHVPIVGALGVGHAPIRLIAKLLCIRKNRMAVGVDIVLRFLRDGGSRNHETKAKKTESYSVTVKVHGKVLRLKVAQNDGAEKIGKGWLRSNGSMANLKGEG